MREDIYLSTYISAGVEWTKMCCTKPTSPLSTLYIIQYLWMSCGICRGRKSLRNNTYRGVTRGLLAVLHKTPLFTQSWRWFLTHFSSPPFVPREGEKGDMREEVSLASLAGEGLEVGCAAPFHFRLGKMLARTVFLEPKKIVSASGVP
jgi:hypothetical protein